MAKNRYRYGMPLPSPRPGESQDDFIGRCMGDDSIRSEFPDQDQRAAVCFDAWRSRSRKDKYQSSHEVVHRPGGKVLVKNLEVFLGFDPEFDDPDGRMAEFDRSKVQDVLKKTKVHMDRGERTKLILLHNQAGDDAPNQEVVGDFVDLRMGDIHGTPGLIGDVEMTAEDFEAYLKSNKFPRRSAEIWPDGHLSEVALLGSQTPARPLPDTRFTKDGEAHRFTRELPVSFAQTGDEDMASETVEDLKAKLKAAEEENESMKAKLKAQEEEEDSEKMQEDEEEEKMKNLRVEKARFERQFKEAEERNESLVSRMKKIEEDHKREKFGRQIDQLRRQGYTSFDEKLVEKLVASKTPDEDLEFYKGIASRQPVEVRVAQFAQAADTGTERTNEKEMAARKRAQERVFAETKGEGGSKATALFRKYLAEEMGTEKSVEAS